MQNEHKIFSFVFDSRIRKSENIFSFVECRPPLGAGKHPRRPIEWKFNYFDDDDHEFFLVNVS